MKRPAILLDGSTSQVVTIFIDFAQIGEAYPPAGGWSSP